jgi:hypothetical protein
MQMFGQQFFSNKKPTPKRPPVELVVEKELTVVNEYTHEDTVTTNKTFKSSKTSERMATRESNRRKKQVSPSKTKISTTKEIDQFVSPSKSSVY